MTAPTGRTRKALALLACALPLGSSCKKDAPKPIDMGAPPPTGAATFEALTLEIGVARALDPDLAPTATEWRRTYVLGKDHAVIIGDVTGEAVAIVTMDGGKTWKSFRGQQEEWGAWGVSKEGIVALATATRIKPPDLAPGRAPPPGQPPRPLPRATHVLFDGGRFSIAPPDAPTFPALGTLIDPAPKPKVPPRPGVITGARLPVDATPIPITKERAAIVFEDGPKDTAGLFHVTRTGVEGTALRFGAGERVIPTPYAKPASLLSYTGKSLYRRVVPDLGTAMPLPSLVVGVVVTPQLVAELSSQPDCEAGDLTFQRVTLPGGRPGVLVVGPERIWAVALPPNATGALGCTAKEVVTELVDDKGLPTVAVCPLEPGPAPAVPPAPLPSASAVAPPVPAPRFVPRARVEPPWTIEKTPTCTFAAKPPFRLWNDRHEREMHLVPTEQGVIAFLEMKSGERWGMYLAHSVEKGTIYEVSRRVGEGSGERGKIELAAVVPFGKRTVFLFTADIMGTVRRGYYVIATEDGGNTWAPP